MTQDFATSPAVMSFRAERPFARKVPRLPDMYLRIRSSRATPLVFASGWAFHVKWQRRAITAEMRRVSRERNDLQAQATPAQIESSESRRLPAPRKGRQP